MATLTEMTVVDLIEVLPNGCLQIRSSKRVYADDVEIATAPPHRHVLEPGQDLTGQDARVVAIAEATWTPDVVSAWQAAQAAQIAEMEGGA